MERSLPEVILPLGMSQREVRDPEGASIVIVNDQPEIYTEYGMKSRDDFLEWSLDKSVYVSTDQRGIFDTIFKDMPTETLRDLAITGESKYKNYSLLCYGRDGSLSIRKGNRWGSISNVNKLLPDGSPKGIRQAVELASLRMNRYGFPDLDFRSVGRVAQDLLIRHCRYQPRPPIEHTWMYLQSFKGARMEGVIFGTSEVFDYDIRSAFPSLVSELWGTRGIDWVDSDSIITDAKYAAVLCDVYINEHLIRGPVAVRDGEHSLYFPVGQLTRIWINKPEVDLLLSNPHLGRITRIYRGSWGVGGSNTKPFRRLIRQLFNIRSCDDFLGPYLKLTMAALWGKFISTYIVINDVDEGIGWTQASCVYNPVLASHVTSSMRCSLYLRSLGESVVGEFIDGLSTTRPLSDLDDKFGHLVEKGRGTMVLFNDSVKGCSWKNSTVLEYSRIQRDQGFLELPMKYYHTLKSALRMFGTEGINGRLGREFRTTQHIHLGSSMRFMGEENLRVGDLLEGTRGTYPPRMGEMKLFKFLRGTEHDGRDILFGEIGE